MPIHRKTVPYKLKKMEEDDECCLNNLFVCEDYVEKTWNIGNLTQKLLCSNMSSTDHDLTGQIVWPASIQLCWYLYNHREELYDKQILELGAGCGLAGFFASNFCKSIVITDGNDVVLRLLEQNKTHLNIETCDVAVEKLLWGSADAVQSLLSNISSVPSVIIGADVILWPNLVKPLLTTIYLLLAQRATVSNAYISYIVRANTTTQLVLETAEQLGLFVETIDSSTFLPDPQPAGLQNTEKCMFKICIADPTSISTESVNDFIAIHCQNDTEKTFDEQSNAC